MGKPYNAMQTPICRCGHTPVIHRSRRFDRVEMRWLPGLTGGFGQGGYEWRVYCRYCIPLVVYKARDKRAAIAAFENANAVEVRV